MDGTTLSLVSRRTLRKLQSNGLSSANRAVSKPSYDRMSSFAQKHLTRFGWKEGQSLGKKNQGISEPVHLIKKRDMSGLGSKEQSNPDWFEDTWKWTDMYNSASKSFGERGGDEMEGNKAMHRKHGDRRDGAVNAVRHSRKRRKVNAPGTDANKFVPKSHALKDDTRSEASSAHQRRSTKSQSSPRALVLTSRSPSAALQKPGASGESGSDDDIASDASGSEGSDSNDPSSDSDVDSDMDASGSGLGLGHAHRVHMSRKSGSANAPLPTRYLGSFVKAGALDHLSVADDDTATKNSAAHRIKGGDKVHQPHKKTKTGAKQDVSIQDHVFQNVCAGRTMKTYNSTGKLARLERHESSKGVPALQPVAAAIRKPWPPRRKLEPLASDSTGVPVVSSVHAHRDHQRSATQMQQPNKKQHKRSRWSDAVEYVHGGNAVEDLNRAKKDKKRRKKSKKKKQRKARQ